MSIDSSKMKVVAAYLLALLGGNTSPFADDLKNILGSVGADCDKERIELLLSEVKGKDIAAGREKLASAPFGVGVAAAATAVGGGVAPSRSNHRDWNLIIRYARQGIMVNHRVKKHQKKKKKKKKGSKVRVEAGDEGDAGDDESLAWIREVALHSESVKAGVESDVVVGTSIVPLAQRNVVTWTVMVEGYASNGQMKAAKDIFEAMPQRNFFVYSSMISGYFKNGDVEEGKAIFDRVKGYVRGVDEAWPNMHSAWFIQRLLYG
ncbi:hypothetical protein L6452_08626 [Arctium lappa]|uniref:Uncharacterized protein n=1 Tax=Arctium lappa TaxID=4217 RepID=A0ACB9DIU4_ARCLA|nr:hypothetical protein L6452_08626 [Arctium lappa]